jgi:outer membrane protein assembly factor BamB
MGDVRRMIVRIGITGVLVASTAGCWPAPGAGPDRRSHNPFETVITVDNVATLREEWTATLPEGGVSSPVVSNSGVHVYAGDALYGVDRSTGAVRWRTPVPVLGRVYAGHLVVVGDRLLASYGWVSEAWEGHWYDTRTGTDVGASGDAMVSSVRGGDVLSARVFAVSGGDGMTGLALRTIGGEPGSWSGMLDSPGPGATAPALTLGREHVYHSGWAIDSDGPTRSRGVRAFPVHDARTDCGPSVFPDVACPTWFTPLDAADIEPVLSADGTTLYASTATGTIHALDTATGAVLWSASVGAAVSAPPAMAGGVLFVPTEDGNLVAVDAGGCGAPTCAPLWTATTGARISGQPAVAGGVVFTGSVEGSLHALDAAGCGASVCAPLWSTDTGSGISGAPAVTGGQLYVGTVDGRLVAYAPDPEPAT